MLAGPVSSVIDDFARVDTRQMSASALQAEFAAYVAQFNDQLDGNGHRLVVGNGNWQPREVLPLLYLHGLSTSDFGPALEQFLGTGAGLSVTTIARLTGQWQDDVVTFATVRFRTKVTEGPGSRAAGDPWSVAAVLR